VRGFIKALILVPVSLIVVLLAIANRSPVALSLDPFSRTAPAFSVSVPLFAALLGAVMIGVVIGGVASWMAQGKHRQAGRRHRRDAERLAAETQRLKNALSSRNQALPGGRQA
jgi:uncharacterized integral membrane protein